MIDFRQLLLSQALRDDGVKSLREDTLEVRKGVAPGSFLDLLMHGKDRTTGEGFTDLALANQVLTTASTYSDSCIGVQVYSLCRDKPKCQHRSQGDSSLFCKSCSEC